MLRTAIRQMSKVVKPDSEWRLQLLPAAYQVLRQGSTEPAGSGEYNKAPAAEHGVYRCEGCSNPLYRALTKFDSHCGWPAFFEAIPGSVTTLKDTSYGMVREEMRCAKCDGHLGHIFRGEGFKTPTDERHCVNSVCLKFTEDESA